MERLGLIIVLLLGHSAAMAAGTPAAITYQGTLWQSGVPATGPHDMGFRLTDVSGSAQYGSVVTLSNVQVKKGLFAVQLDFSAGGATPVDWQNITPYIQVSIDGQALSPTEPIRATVYALMSASVVDGSVTRRKLDPATVQGNLIPSGMIALFADACPPGWSVYKSLQGRFPVGSDPANLPTGSSGGNLAHAHTISTDGAHDHGGWTGYDNPNNNSDAGDGSPTMAGHRHSIPKDGAHNHGGATGPASSLPPYLALVFCQK